MPNLETLEFGDRDVDNTTSEEDTNFIQAIVSRAANLRNLYTRGCVNLSANLLEGSQAVHVTIYQYRPSLNEIPECAARSLHMRRMDLKFVGENFHSITSELLQRNCDRLSWLDMAAPFLVPLMAYGIQLKNVRVLHINIDTTCFHGRVNQKAWNAMKSFDFNYVFPILRTAHIIAGDKFRESFKDALAAFCPTVPKGYVATHDRAINIIILIVKWRGILRRPSAEALAQMFPNLRFLSIEAKGMIPFEEIWKSWLQLKKLDVTLRGIQYDRSWNLDSVLCGIFPEEVAELREKDDEYLKAVNIVPVMPSITCLTRLRNFSIHLTGNHMVHNNDDPPEFMFSRVTPLIAFRNVDVIIWTDDRGTEEALSHLIDLMPNVRILGL